MLRSVAEPRGPAGVEWGGMRGTERLWRRDPHRHLPGHAVAPRERARVAHAHHAPPERARLGVGDVEGADAPPEHAPPLRDLLTAAVAACLAALDGAEHR